MASDSRRRVSASEEVSMLVTMPRVSSGKAMGWMIAEMRRAKTCRCGSLVGVVSSRPIPMPNSFAPGARCQ